MSHHYSPIPTRSSPMGDARLDLTDLYAFPKPGDAGKSILIMNLHPSVGENPRGPTTAEPFAPEALSACMECDPKSNVIITVLHAHSSNGRRYRRQRDGRRHRPRRGRIGIHDQPLILGQRFRGSNHIRRPRQACRTKCG